MGLDIESMLVDEEKEVQEQLARQEEQREVEEVKRQSQVQQQQVQYQQPVQRQQYQDYNQQDMNGVNFNANAGIPHQVHVNGMAMQAGIVAQFAVYDKSVKWSRRITLILLLIKVVLVQFSTYYSFVMNEYAPYDLTGHGFAYLLPTFLNELTEALIVAAVIRVIIHVFQWFNRHKMQKLVPVWIYWIVYVLHIFIA